MGIETDVPPMQQFPPELSSVPAARGLVSASLAATDDADLALLLASELSTNAVHHAKTPFTVAISHDRDGNLTVEVHDHDPSLPVIKDVGPTALRGRGLRIVDEFSQAWGVTMLHDDGKTVWFRLHPVD
jgi:anti-sigma regulatory factor (Ser/Thr protein kinase)